MKVYCGFSLVPAILVGLTTISASGQQAPVPLGSSSTFAVLAGTTVTFTGGGTITGNVGISPGTALVAGNPATMVNGTEYLGDPIAAQAQADLTVAYNNAAGRLIPQTLSGNIGGQTLTPGLYSSTSTLSVTSGILTLDAQGDANAVFIFQIASSFGVSTQVALINGAQANNVYWQVGSSATIDVGAVLHGNILAQMSITLNTGATLDGRALARDGAVTIDTGGGTNITLPAAPPGQFVPVPPCRVVDTRMPSGDFGGPFIAGQTRRDFTLPSGSCGIPSTALTYSLNIAVVPRGPFAYLTAWPTGQLQPPTATLNSDGRIKSNAAFVSAGTAGAVSIFVTHDADVVLDINGYFAPIGTQNALSFYPVTPCRISDTRNPNGLFGGPFIAGQTFRTLDVVASGCGVPAGAGAYSINLAAVPRGPLGYLTSWAAGSLQPYVASLNASTATITSNAAIVPAGLNDAIDIFASNDTDLIVDINGYFATPGLGGLSLYGVSPCRALDTRLPSGALPFTGLISTDIVAGSCGVPVAAQAIVLTAVAIPQEPLGYLTLWAQGSVQPPLVASLNAVDAAITSNMAIVPTVNGQISAFASNSSHLVLDVFGYFAP